jgi:hypothetical protein
VVGEESFNLSPDWATSKPGFSYYGDGLASGQCGIKIDRVPASANGQIKCHLGLRGPEISKEISLIVAGKVKIIFMNLGKEADDFFF